MFHWIVIGTGFGCFFVRNDLRERFRRRGVMAGIRLGVLLEIAAIGMRHGFYAVQPIPGKLVFYESIGGLIEMVIVGAIVGAIYKPASVGPS